MLVRTGRARLPNERCWLRGTTCSNVRCGNTMWQQTQQRHVSMQGVRRGSRGNRGGKPYFTQRGRAADTTSTRTRTRTRTHVHTRAYTCTHAHTHVYVNGDPHMPCGVSRANKYCAHSHSEQTSGWDTGVYSIQHSTVQAKTHRSLVRCVHMRIPCTRHLHRKGQQNSNHIRPSLVPWGHTGLTMSKARNSGFTGRRIEVGLDVPVYTCLPGWGRPLSRAVCVRPCAARSRWRARHGASICITTTGTGT